MITENQVTLQKNSITHRKADWTPTMTKCFVQILAEFDVRFQEWERLHPKNLFGDEDYGMLCEYSFPAEELTKYVHGENLSSVKTALYKLSGYLLTIKGSEDDPNADHDWEVISIIDYSRYDAKTKRFTVRLTHSICPYLVEAKRRGRFTMYNPFIARQFQGKYTERFYEFICQYRRKTDKDGKPIKLFFLMIDEMREMFCLNADPSEGRKKDKYTRLNDFIEYVIKPSQEELEKLYMQEACDVYFTFSKGDAVSTGGRPTIDRIWFKIHERTEAKIVSQAPPIPYPNNREGMNAMNNKYLYLINVLGHVFDDEHGRNYLNLIKLPLATAMGRDRELADKIIEKIRGLQSDPTVRSKASYARTILEKEFGIKTQRFSK